MITPIIHEKVLFIETTHPGIRAHRWCRQNAGRSLRYSEL